MKNIYEVSANRAEDNSEIKLYFKTFEQAKIKYNHWTKASVVYNIAFKCVPYNKQKLEK